MRIWEKNSVITGIWLGLATILVSSALIVLVFYFFDISFDQNRRFFLLASIPNMLLIRYYKKKLQGFTVAQTLVVISVLSVIPFLIYLMRVKEITFS